jgi:hypothetical protein
METQGIGCQRTDSGHDYGRCDSHLSLTVTGGAYIVEPTADNDDIEATAEAGAMLHGQASVSTVILVETSEVEAQANTMFQETPEIHQLTPNPPTLDEMLVQNSEGSQMLGTMFSTTPQQPHVVYPLSIAPGDAVGVGRGGHRRELQSSGDRYAHVQVEVHAPTAAEAQRALDRVAQRVGGVRQGSMPTGGSPGKGRRRVQTGGDCATTAAPPPTPPIPPPSALVAPVVLAPEPSFTVPVCALGSMPPECTLLGQTVHTDTIIVANEELEAQSRSLFDATPPVDRSSAAPPTIQEMLVGGTEGSALLSSMFVAQQQPHQIFPVSYQEVSAQEASMLMDSKQSTTTAGLSFIAVTVVAQAPTPKGAHDATDEIHAQARSMFPSAVMLHPEDLAQVQQGR